MMDGQGGLSAAAVQQKGVKQTYSPQPSAIKHGFEKKLPLLLHHHDRFYASNNDAA